MFTITNGRGEIILMLLCWDFNSYNYIPSTFHFALLQWYKKFFFLINPSKQLPKPYTVSSTFHSVHDLVEAVYLLSILSLLLPGLTLVIFLEREEFLTGLTSGSGGYVVIHGKRTFPFPDEDGLAVAAGMEVNIAINLVTSCFLRYNA